MSSNVLALLEMLLVLGAVLGLAVWQLVSLSREKRRDERSENRPPPGAS